MVQTTSRIEVPPEFGPDDLARIGFEFERDLGRSGHFPYTRGRREDMYRAELWDMASYGGISSPEETNRRFRYIVANNATPGVRNTLAVALDLPSQVGLDPDADASAGEVGRSGVSVASLRDVEAIYDNIPLDTVRMATVANGIGNVAAAWFAALAIKRGYALDDVVVMLQNDPFKEFTGRGTFIYPMSAHYRLALDVVEHCVRSLPHWKPLSVCGSQLRWGGATAIEEVAFAVAHAEAYLQGLMDRGLALATLLPLIEFHMATDNDVIEEACKFRAQRRLWARRLTARFGLDPSAVIMPHVQTYSAGYTLTAQQPLNNAIRIAMQVVASVLGGVDYVATCSYDEAISTPTIQALTLALRTQQIVAYESGLTNVVDPLGGSYYAEWLTAEIERRVEDLLREIHEQGGPVSAIESGWTNALMADLAYRFQQEVDSGERSVVGVNRYREPEPEDEIETQAVDPALEEARRADMELLRRERSNHEVTRCLRRLDQVARGDENTMEATIDAVLALATVGEICDVFRSIYGVYVDRSMPAVAAVHSG